MELTDARWERLEGGYRQVYDVRPALARLSAGDPRAWEELWQELHHQGDVGEASYAAVPELVSICSDQGLADWNLYALSATIEEARHIGDNPPIPVWLAEDYALAWKRLEALALAELPIATNDDLVSSIIAVLAAAKGKITLARMAMLTEDEREELLGQAGWG